MRAILRLALAAVLMLALPATAQQPPAPALTILDAAGHATTLSMAELRAMPSASLTLPAEHGAPAQLAGPALWPLLQTAGALDPDFHHHVRQVVTATGSDGYTATIALGEIDPEFENKPALVAMTRDGAPLAAPRLAVPGDKRLGRSVRDLVSLTVR